MTDDLSPFASGAAFLAEPCPNDEAEAGFTGFTWSSIGGSLSFLSDCNLEIIPEVPSEFLPYVPGARQAFARATTSAPVTIVNETAPTERGTRADEATEFTGVSCSALSDVGAFGAEEAGRLTTELDKHFLPLLTCAARRSHLPGAREVSNMEDWSCNDQAQHTRLDAAAAKCATRTPTLGERSYSAGMLQQMQGPPAGSGFGPAVRPEGCRQASVPPAAGLRVARWTCGGSAPQLLVREVSAARAASFTLDCVW